MCHSNHSEEINSIGTTIRTIQRKLTQSDLTTTRTIRLILVNYFLSTNHSEINYGSLTILRSEWKN